LHINDKKKSTTGIMRSQQSITASYDVFLSGRALEIDGFHITARRPASYEKSSQALQILVFELAGLGEALRTSVSGE
jgi:hypothetical protein